MKLNCEIDKKNVIQQKNVDKKLTKKFNDEKKSKNRKIEKSNQQCFFCYIYINLIDFFKFDFDKHISIIIDYQFE